MECHANESHSEPKSKIQSVWNVNTANTEETMNSKIFHKNSFSNKMSVDDHIIEKEVSSNKNHQVVAQDDEISSILDFIGDKKNAESVHSTSDSSDDEDSDSYLRKQKYSGVYVFYLIV